MMRNEFKGICYICKNIVNPMMGFLEIIPKHKRVKIPNRFSRPKWRAYHKKCLIKNKEENGEHA